MNNFKSFNYIKNNDEYYTPSIAVLPIIKYLKPNALIWCPFDLCNSEFVLILKEYGFNVIFSHIDYKQDFFNYLPLNFDKVDYIISNLPFSKKNDIIKRLLLLNKPFMMLMSVNNLHYGTFIDLFLKSNKQLQLLLFNHRLSYDGNSSIFASCYYCYNVLPNDLIIDELSNNCGSLFVRSRMSSSFYNNDFCSLFDELMEDYKYEDN